jgi:hypothetical protein
MLEHFKVGSNFVIVKIKSLAIERTSRKLKGLSKGLSNTLAISKLFELLIPYTLI